MIKIDNVSMRFKMIQDKGLSLKEYLIKFAKKQIKYEEFWALKNVSFEIKKGEVVGIIGRNGAGKSTLLKIISGILTPTEGSVKCEGNIVPMLELGSGFDHDLSGRENIFLNGALLGYSKEFLIKKYDEIVEFSELENFIEVPLRNYSSGMVMRLAFSIATVVKPDIMIVDEILSVGDTAFQEKSMVRMKELMSGGTTVLLVSHSINQIRDLCDRALWLDKGKATMFGDAQTVCDVYDRSTLQQQNYSGYVADNYGSEAFYSVKKQGHEYAMIYLDLGIGFNRNETYWYEIIPDGRGIHLLINLHTPCSHVRFDPTFDGGYRVSDLKIDGDGIKPKLSLSAKYKVDKDYYFPDFDPQIDVRFPKPVQCLLIQYKVVPINDAGAF